MDSDMVEFTIGHAMGRQLGDFEMSDVHGGYVGPASYPMHHDSFFAGFEQSGSIGDSDALYSSSSTFGLDCGPDFQNPHIEAQDSYFQSFEGPSSVAGDTGHFHVQTTEIDPTFGETGPTTAHYDFQYPNAYNAIYSPTLASETLVHAQGRNTIVSHVARQAAVPTPQVLPAHPEPLSFVHRAPIDPEHSNDTGPDVPTTGVRMDVPLVINSTEAAIKYYVRDLKQTLGRHVEKVTCSTCLLEDTRRTSQHGTKPTNLERHLFTHFGVKPFMCTICFKRFTTRDQQSLEDESLT